MKVLAPTGLFPNAVKQKLVKGFARLASNCHLALLCRVFELAMVALGVHFYPTVLFEELDDFFYFISVHFFLRRARQGMFFLISRGYLLLILQR